MRKFFFFLALCCFFSFPVLATTLPSSPLSQATTGIKEYLPGDLVHVLVSAPFDTRRITAIMPDDTEISLVRDRKTNVWHGFWQVPLYFKKGVYSAQLKAADMENNSFEGQTNSFFIGELTMITLVGKPSKEAVFASQESTEQIMPPKIAVKPTPPKPKPKIKTAKMAVKKTKTKTRKVKFIAAKSRTDPNLYKAQAATVAHFYLEKQDYKKARTQLKSLVKIDPNNSGVKKLLNRVEIMIKIDKEGR